MADAFEAYLATLSPEARTAVLTSLADSSLWLDFGASMRRRLVAAGMSQDTADETTDGALDSAPNLVIAEGMTHRAFLQELRAAIEEVLGDDA